MYERYIERYERTPILLQLFFVEMYIRVNEPDLARSTNEYLLYLAPDFIPAKVLDYRLETDTIKRRNKIEYLHDKYPEHWLVKAYYQEAQN